jgi:hypothetical protein
MNFADKGHYQLNFPASLFYLKFLLELAEIPQETRLDASRAEKVRPRARYIVACCDKQYRPPRVNGAAQGFSLQ